MKRLSLVALVSVIAVAALTTGCGGSSTTTVIAPSSAATNTAAEGASAQDELIASQLAATNGGALLATVCSSIQNVGSANAEESVRKSSDRSSSSVEALSRTSWVCCWTNADAGGSARGTAARRWTGAFHAKQP